MKKPSRALSISEKRFFVASGVGVLLLVGLGAFNVSRNTVPVINFPTPVKRPNPNGFDLYIAAGKATIFAKPAVDAVDDINVKTPAQAAIAYSLPKRRAWLKKNTRVFALFDQAMKTPCMYPNLRDKTDTPPFGYLRTMGRSKVIEANTFKLAQQPAKAVESSLDCIQMSVDVAKNSNLIGTLIAHALQAIGCSILDRSGDVTIDQLSESEAKAATTRLESLLERDQPILECVKEDRWQTLSMYLQQFKTDNGWRSHIFELDDKPLSWKEKISVQLISPNFIIGQINANYDWYEQELQKPYRPSDSKSATKPPESNPLLDQFRLEIGGFKSIEAHRNVSLKMLLMRMALRAYQAKNGRFPKTLDELAPQYLKVIPTDDYAAGKPFFYRLKGKSYELWSIGPDGKNDNGKAIINKDENGKTTKSASTVFGNSKGDYVAGKNR